MIEIKKLTKTYKKGSVETHVLKGIDLKIKEAEFVAIMGRSGAGKSTLLYQMSGLDKPTSGTVKVNGKKISRLGYDERTDFRLKNMGFIFQDYALLPELNAIENVSMPLIMRGMAIKEAYLQAQDALRKVGLEHRFENLPSELSGGEQQRVSIARSIVHHPKILFADEPTANLDNKSSDTVISILEDLHKKEDLTIVMVTHEDIYGKRAERIIEMDDGLVI